VPEQLYWNDVREGMEIGPLEKIATTQTLVKWAGASGDFNPLHYDAGFAAAVGAGKPIVHGALKRQWLIQLLTDWMGRAGFLKKFACQYRAMDYPRQMKTMTMPQDGETWQGKGKVLKKYVEGTNHLADIDVKLLNGKGEVTVSGRATVILPVR